MGASNVEACLVDRWFNKIFNFSVDEECSKPSYVIRKGEDGRTEAIQANDPQYVFAPAIDTGWDDGGVPTFLCEEVEMPESTFYAQTVCGIGEGVLGMAALTGKKLCIRDCSLLHQQKHIFSSTRKYDSGILVCWPVEWRLHAAYAAFPCTSGNSVLNPAPEMLSDELPVAALLEEFEGGVKAEIGDGSWSKGSGETGDSTAIEHSASAVMAVLQIHYADGQFSMEAIEVLRNVARLLAPLLTDALVLVEEGVRRRSTEALFTLGRIIPRKVGLVEMVERIVAVAEQLMEAERVCLYFVDDAADELWVATSVDFEGVKIKIGQGLCGHSAATGEVVNVIDSYEDSRFDSQWDKQTGFTTKR